MTTETPNPASNEAPPPGDPASLLSTSPLPPAGGEQQPPPEPGPNDWMPTKFHVTKDDGSFDPDASARKLAESYTALEKHKGPVLTVPETPEGYKLEAPLGEDGKPLEGVDIEAFMADPMFKGIAAKAHAKGIPNEHMQLFMDEYLRTAPQLFAANAELTVKDASAELSKVWTDEKTFESKLQQADRTVAEFTKDVPDDQPGSFKRLTDKFKNDPDFAAFVARIGGEVEFGEDKVPRGGEPSADMEIDALMRGEAYWNPQHADHAKVKGQVDAHFAKKHGTAAHR